MRFNQFSFIPMDKKNMLSELQFLGYTFSTSLSDKENLENFVRWTQFLTVDTDVVLSQWIADEHTDLLHFFHSDIPLTESIFYHVSFQLLGFIPFIDYTDVQAFYHQTGLPIAYGDLLTNLYQLLCTRTKRGNTLVDQLVSDGLIPEDNCLHFFNGKSLATFDTKDLIREIVYVETPVDTDKDGQTDLIKVSILRPTTTHKLPVIMTQSPYHQGVNEIASDRALHKMEEELIVKKTQQLSVQELPITYLTTAPIREEHYPATEKLGHLSTYSLNDYLLARGIASVYVSGIGTLHSDGFMTSGDEQQVMGYKAVVDWLNGRAVAFTDHSRKYQTKAIWANGKVATTGLSYLGTMSNALATTGVEGLEVIIAEAGISSWYDYYRENGLVTSPGGYPGEDLDSLTAFTYSKALQAGDWLRNQNIYTQELAKLQKGIERQTGNYNHFWHARNYLPKASNIQCDVVFTHGTQDWNVKPLHVYQMFHALPSFVSKHLFLHHGSHIYMNNWQSIDFRESINALLSQKLLGLQNNYQLPSIIWQDNQADQTWSCLDNFIGNQQLTLPLGLGQGSILNRYDSDVFAAYSKSYSSFQDDLWTGKANQLTIDLPLPQDIRINGRVKLHLRMKSTTNKGLISAQILEIGTRLRHGSTPIVKERLSLDNGRFYSMEHLLELPFTEMPQRIITKSHLNLQHRSHLLLIEPVHPEEWMTFDWELQPTIYALQKDDTLRILLYTTDFETTIRDNSDWALTVDLDKSYLTLPID